MANDSTAVARLDSMSYALGYQYTKMVTTDDNELMRNEDDYSEFICGLEEHVLKSPLSSDSSYVVSYCAGGMQGAFLTDAYSRKEDMTFVSYIVEGLRKVAEDKVVLPDDTIKANAVLNRYSKKDGTPKDMKEKAQREFFNAYGILKAYQRGLQEYINSFKPDMNVTFDRRAYAKGMADVLEMCMFSKPKSAYDLGKYSSISVNMMLMDKKDYSPSSYVSGAKAALNLGEPLIDKDVLEEIFNANYDIAVADSVAVDETDKDEKFGKLMNYAMQLDMGINNVSEKYIVDWDVTAQQIADYESSVADYLGEMVMKTNLDINDTEKICIYGDLLMALVKDDETGDTYNSILSVIKDVKLPKGYEWFCNRNDDKEVIVGIAESNNVFKAKAIEASVEFNYSYGYFTTEFAFDKKGAVDFSKFTDENVGRHFVMKINGIFACAPKINCQITSGNCAATGLTPENVNRLFKGAKLKKSDDKVDNAADEIEVINVE